MYNIKQFSISELLQTEAKGEKRHISSPSNFQFSNQKGVSLLFAVLIMSVILAIGMGISGILIQQTRMVGEIEKSIVSFYAADSGVERELFDLYKTPYPQSNLSGFLSVNSSNDASFNVTVKCGATSDCLAGFTTSSGCSALNFCLKSTGSYQKTKRAIEIKY